MKNSEPIFAEYLRLIGLQAEYERHVGARRPDFSIWHEGHCMAFWDVADRKFSDEDQRELDEIISRSEREELMVKGGPTKDYHFVRYRVDKKARQFKECGDLPGMLVVAEWAGQCPFTPEMIAAALYGWPTISFKLNGDRSLSLGRADGGKMVDPEKREWNRRISAIGVLRIRKVNRYLSGLEAFRTMALDKYPITHAWQLILAEEVRLKGTGLDLDLDVPVLDIFLTAGASQPWPESLTGPYDRVFEYSYASSEFVIARDGLLPARIPELPASETQRAIWDIMSDPNLRCDP